MDYNSTSAVIIRIPSQLRMHVRLLRGMYCYIPFGRAGFPDFRLTDTDGHAGPDLGFLSGLGSALDIRGRGGAAAGRPDSVKVVSLDRFRAALTMAGPGWVSAFVTHPG